MRHHETFADIKNWLENLPGYRKWRYSETPSLSPAGTEYIDVLTDQKCYMDKNWLSVAAYVRLVADMPRKDSKSSMENFVSDGSLG